MRITTLSLTVLALVGCDYSAPVMSDFEDPLNVIAGTVAVDSIDEPTHTILFITDASNPGPPEGTGSPESFTTVPGRLFTDTSAAGLSGAPWSITNVPDGSWLVSGFMDRDDNFFFSTAISALAGATCGDVLGAHVVDVETQALAEVEVSGGELADNVTVALVVELTTERPAFTIEAESIDGSQSNGPAISIATALDDGVLFPQQFKIKATSVHADLAPLAGAPLEYNLEGPFDPAAPAPCQTGILGRLVDADLDGNVDEPPGLEGNGLIEAWPKIFLSYDGSTDTDVWVGQAFVSPFMRPIMAGQSNGVDDDGDGTIDETNDLPLNSPVFLPEMAISWAPAALHIYPRTDANGNIEFDDDGQPIIIEELVTDASQIPTGNWSVTIVEETGQTWSMPNDLANFPAVAGSQGYDPERQAEFLVIEP